MTYIWIFKGPPKSFFSKKTVILSKSRMKAIHLKFQGWGGGGGFSQSSLLRWKISKLVHFLFPESGVLWLDTPALNWVPAEVSLCGAAAFREKVFRHRQRAEMFLADCEDFSLSLPLSLMRYWPDHSFHWLMLFPNWISRKQLPSFTSLWTDLSLIRGRCTYWLDLLYYIKRGKCEYLTVYVFIELIGIRCFSLERDGAVWGLNRDFRWKCSGYVLWSFSWSWETSSEGMYA